VSGVGRGGWAMTVTERVEDLLARKVREERLRRSMTLAALSEQCNVSVAMLSKIENARVSPPISTYSKIAKCFGIPLGKLFAEEATPPVSLVRRTERKRYTRFPGYTGEAVAYKKTNRKWNRLSLRMRPERTTPGLHARYWILVSTNADIVIAPGRMGGTNAIFIRDPASFHVDYYGASFLKHLKIASGLHTEVFDSFNISTDIDEVLTL